MSTQVKIVIAAINIACLIITLVVPTDITPFILLTTIATAIPWAFSTQERIHGPSKGLLLLYISYASFLALCCIVFGIITYNVHADAGGYFLVFKKDIAFFANVTFNYLYFAIPAFVLIPPLMIAEIIASLIKGGINNQKKAEFPIATTIKLQLKNSLKNK